jgi:hypothetical protein
LIAGELPRHWHKIIDLSGLPFGYFSTSPSRGEIDQRTNSLERTARLRNLEALAPSTCPTSIKHVVWTDPPYSLDEIVSIAHSTSASE